VPLTALATAASITSRSIGAYLALSDEVTEKFYVKEVKPISLLELCGLERPVSCFFLMLSLKHLEQRPSVDEEPKNPHPALHN
jgi:hypothetical protein